ncbi:hypothetical protein KC19_7G124500 [Ceratodon purpureus]|uniref:Uncharacterized protein n=1 Tax=Ceratodon purpureus TaxID=3225 RepID=A0A8T0H9B8_CERPU|nr:hypothetical protein KC19_7G124500 [Ceratodon purpureus]
MSFFSDPLDCQVPSARSSNQSMVSFHSSTRLSIPSPDTAPNLRSLTDTFAFTVNTCSSLLPSCGVGSNLSMAIDESFILAFPNILKSSEVDPVTTTIASGLQSCRLNRKLLGYQSVL